MWWGSRGWVGGLVVSGVVGVQGVVGSRGD